MKLQAELKGQMQKEGFARFFVHVVDSDPRLRVGILCYIGILLLTAVFGLVIDAAGAKLMGRASPAQSEGGDTTATQDQTFREEILLLCCLVGLELVLDILKKYMFVLLNKFVRDPFHTAGVRYALNKLHDSSPYWIAGRNPRYMSLFALRSRAELFVVVRFRSTSTLV